MVSEERVEPVERQHKLLVVDDEFLNRDMLKERLQRSGFAVAEAEDAQQALVAIEQGGIDLVLLDTMMPGMSGIDLLRLLRAVHGPSELPVIMATAVTDSKSISGALELGANDYVTKPIDYQVALARIRSQLKRKATEQALRESEERYALAMRGTGDGIWDWDLGGGRIYYSPRWKAIIGCEESEIGDSPEEWLGRVHAEDRAKLRMWLATHWADVHGGPFVCEYRILHKDGTYHWMLGRGHTVRDQSNRAVRMTGSHTDITEQKIFDPLTGLPNRLLFLERAGQTLEVARQHPGYGFAVLFLDVDRFKLVNDSMGHLAGDRLLAGLADRLRNAISQISPALAIKAPTVARFGGDEFAILLEGLEHASDADVFAESVLRALSEPVETGGRDVYCSVSIGIAAGNAGYGSVEDVLRDADAAMYAAKAKGGSQYATFDDTMRQRAAERLAIESGLRKALERSELVVYYQPKVVLDTSKLVGFEALVRWQHPDLGLLAPSTFIPIAEETGLIIPIGEWVMREACRQLREWQIRYPKSPPLAVSANLSIRQFRQPDLVASIKRILDETGLEAAYLQLELTESVVMDDPESAITTVQQIKNLGVGIKLDDFGTGYSSLSCLCRMPIDALKIDRSFIVRMARSSPDLEMVRTVLSLAHSLGMDVVAEGVESTEQLDQLRALGCQYAQGYYFGKPISAVDTSMLLESMGTGTCPDSFVQ